MIIGKCFRYLYNKTKGISPKQKLKIMRTATKKDEVTTKRIVMAFAKGDKPLPSGRKVGQIKGQLYNCCPNCNPDPITNPTVWEIMEFDLTDIEDYFDEVDEEGVDLGYSLESIH